MILVSLQVASWRIKSEHRLSKIRSESLNPETDSMTASLKFWGLHFPFLYSNSSPRNTRYKEKLSIFFLYHQIFGDTIATKRCYCFLHFLSLLPSLRIYYQMMDMRLLTSLMWVSGINFWNYLTSWPIKKAI